MEPYEKLRELLDAHPSGAPPSKAFDEILRVLFSPEEAALASHMTLTLRPPVSGITCIWAPMRSFSAAT